MAFRRESVLTATKRQEICVHEAAHAIIYALGGSVVHSLNVAPVGATDDYDLFGFEGEIITDYWSSCTATFEPIPSAYWRWNYKSNEYVTDTQGFRRYVASGAAEGLIDPGTYYRDIRAHMCALVAGRVADLIYAGWNNESPYHWLEPYNYHYGDDIYKAETLTYLLPWHNELQHAITVTEQALRKPEIWQAVLKLADRLYKEGSLDFMVLPENWKNWPPTPMNKNYKIQ